MLHLYGIICFKSFCKAVFKTRIKIYPTHLYTCKGVTFSLPLIIFQIKIKCMQYYLEKNKD